MGAATAAVSLRGTRGVQSAAIITIDNHRARAHACDCSGSNMSSQNTTDEAEAHAPQFGSVTSHRDGCSRRRASISGAATTGR